MRIVLDAQSVQFELASGVCNGPLLTFTAAFLRHREQHEVILLLRAAIGDTVEQIRAALNPLIASDQLRIWHAPAPASDGNQPTVDGWIAHAGACIFDAVITRIEPDVVVITQRMVPDSMDDVIRPTNTVGNFWSAVVVAPSARTESAPVWPPQCHADGLQLQLSGANLIGALAPLVAGEICKVFGSAPCRDVPGQETIDAATPESLADQILQATSALKKRPETSQAPLSRKKKLAYVSPLPPLRSGISDYSADLLTELVRHYDIEVIVDQNEVSAPWIMNNCTVRNIQWFYDHPDHYDRIIYHFGNSSFHQHMFEMHERAPGVIVLHDFFLGDVINFLEAHHLLDSFLSISLYRSHGYKSILDRFTERELSNVIRQYPANLHVLLNAQGVIVHSNYSKKLADQWYGRNFSSHWSVIPLLRKIAKQVDRDQIRATLGYKPTDFLVCSFGFLGPTKLNHSLLDAWLQSEMVHNQDCYLVFVGEIHGGDYGVHLEKTIKDSLYEKRIRITGWADEARFHAFLDAADVAVQLRSQSRGETSAAVFDCMSRAVPTVVNAHGSFAELPHDAVWMLPEEFDTGDLTYALESLWHDPGLRRSLGGKARAHVSELNNPGICARQYARAIEESYAHSSGSIPALIRQISAHNAPAPNGDELAAVASAIAESMPEKRAARQLLVDVSATCRNDLKTGIQRVVRALVWELIQAPPVGYRIEPVYLTDEGGRWHYRYARTWTSGVLGVQCEWLPDDAAEFYADDVLLVADFTARFAVEAENCGLLSRIKETGVGVHFVVYDLLPILTPEFFPPGQFGFSDWIHTVNRVANSALCISESVAKNLRAWVNDHPEPRFQPIDIGWFHLGADIDQSAPTKGMMKDARRFLSIINSAPSFLMVGTIEPRKGYSQVVDAFTRLWTDGVQINLVIVGKEGWLGLPDDQRRTIPEVIDKLRHHPESGKRLLWMNGASDEFLLTLYASCTCLIAASEGEGFGLPLIEAAQHKIPIIARDIPVFREVAGTHAYYFDGLRPEDLAVTIQDWLALNKYGAVPSSSDMPWLTWKQSAQRVLQHLGLLAADA